MQVCKSTPGASWLGRRGVASSPEAFLGLDVLVQPSRSSFAIFRSVMFALWYRDVRSKAGETGISWLWAVAGAAAGVALFSMLAGVKGRGELLFGMEYPVFVLTGMVPFALWSGSALAGVLVLGQYGGVFIFRQVKPFDLVAARFLQVVAIQGSALLVLMGVLGWLGFSVLPQDPLLVLVIIAALGLMGIGISLLTAVAALFVPGVRKALPLVVRPLLFLSGVLVPLQAIPSNFHDYLLWNPVLHCLELLRQAWCVGFVPAPGITWIMVWFPGLTLLALGLLAYYRYRAPLVGEQ